jgi:predicted MFS family arabinose efflux permease
MSRDMGVSEAQIGLLITVFAATVVLATAPISALTRHHSRKRLVFFVLLVNAVATLGTALAPSYPFLMGARVLGGLAHGLFWAVAGAYAAHLVPREQLAKAVVITSFGGSAAFVLGVPLGTALGHAVGWRLSFAVIAGAMVLLSVLVVFFLPPVDHRVPLKTGEIEIPLRRDRSLLAVLGLCLVIVVALTGQNIFYTYIAPFVVGPIGFDGGSVGSLLLLYGAAGVVGLILSGPVASRFPVPGMVIAVVGSSAMLVILGLFPGNPVVAIPVVALWGLLQGAVAPLFQTRMMQVASGRLCDAASAWMTTAFNVGIGGGAAIGAFLLTTSGLETLPFFAAGGILIAAVVVVVVERVTVSDPHPPILGERPASAH